MSFELIETVEVGAGGAASIEFTSIPQDGTDLVVLCSLRRADTSQASLTRIQLNGVTTGYSFVRLFGNGSTSSNQAASGQVGFLSQINPGDTTSDTFNNASHYIPNYTGNSAKISSVDDVTENNGATGFQTIVANLSTVTDPVTSLLLKENSGQTIAQHSTASLYKITAA